MSVAMTENDIAKEVVDACFQIHNTLGPGLLESVYETVLEHELTSRGLTVSRQVGIPVVYGELHLGDGFRADLIVGGKVIVEIKSIETVPSVAFKILLTYLRLADLRLGLLVNFHEDHIKNGIKRVVNNL
jgi:GxxExxY protein